MSQFYAKNGAKPTTGFEHRSKPVRLLVQSAVLRVKDASIRQGFHAPVLAVSLDFDAHRRRVDARVTRQDRLNRVSSRRNFLVGKRLTIPVGLESSRFAGRERLARDRPGETFVGRPIPHCFARLVQNRNVEALARSELDWLGVLTCVGQGQGERHGFADFNFSFVECDLELHGSGDDFDCNRLGLDAR